MMHGEAEICGQMVQQEYATEQSRSPSMLIRMYSSAQAEEQNVRLCQLE